MAILGFGDLRDTALPSLIDLAELKKIELADGTTFDQVANEIRVGMQALNAELLAMPHYGGLFSVQDSVEVEYPVGTTNGIEVATEYSTGDPKRGATTGHSLPILPYRRVLGWTFLGLRKSRRTTIDADVRSAVTDIRSGWQKSALTRFFKSTAETVGATSGASVPFADGGTADSNYIPLPSPEGKTFLSSHSHYLRVSTLDLSTAINPAIAHLAEHGHASPFEIIGSEADVATWSSLVKHPNWEGLIYRAATDRANVGDIGSYFGYIETDYGIARVWLSPRVPTAYFGAFKTYGEGDPRNPIRVRIDPKTGFGWNIVSGQWVNMPLNLAVLYAEYGFGIGEDRTNGVAVKIYGSGSYTDPTIS